MRGISEIDSIYLTADHEFHRETYMAMKARGEVEARGGLARCFPLRKLDAALFCEPPNWIQFALDNAPLVQRVATLSLGTSRFLSRIVNRARHTRGKNSSTEIFS